MSNPSSLSKLFRLQDLPDVVALKRTQILDLVRVGKFPKPIKLSDSGRAIAWLESDLIAWQLSRVQLRNGAERSSAQEVQPQDNRRPAAPRQNSSKKRRA